MARKSSDFESYVDQLPDNPLFQFLGKWVLVPLWAWMKPVAKLPGGPPPSIQPSDNVQRMMNLIMPLKNKSAIGRARAAMTIAENVDELYAGLDNVGTVHFARFVIVENNLCMISVYDGDFSNYIRDFVATIGSVFDAVVELVEDGDAVIPCEKNVEAFIDWVHARDLFQVPDLITDLMDEQSQGAAVETADLTTLARGFVLQLNANRNVSLGTGYRAYPGYSAAQVRRKLGVGW
jgi:hypothetical protein